MFQSSQSNGWSSGAQNYSGSLRTMLSYFSLESVKILLSGIDIHEIEGKRLIDIAAGPATFTYQFVNFIGLEDASKLLSIMVSDFAKGMIDAGKDIIDSLEYPMNNLEYSVIDAQDMSVIGDNTIDYAAIMFGVMFPPRRDLVFHELYRIMSTNYSRAVISTWRVAGIALLFDSFATYLGTYKPGCTPGAIAGAVCSDPVDFELEIRAAQFNHIQMFEASHVLELPATHETFLSFVSNPIIASTLGSNSPKDVLPLWDSFLTSPNCSTWFHADSNTLRITQIANIALVTK